MIKKSYSSIEDINKDLNILRVKRELHYQKVFQSVDIIKEELTPDRLLKSSVGSMVAYVKSSGSFQAFIITTILKQILNRRKNK